MTKKERFTVHAVVPVPGTQNTWANVADGTEGAKYELRDDSFVYDRYDTREEAEQAAADILGGEKADLISTLREAEQKLADSKLGNTSEGEALLVALAIFVEKYQR